MILIFIIKKIKMSSPWKVLTKCDAAPDLADIMSEEIARGLQVKENSKFAEMMTTEGNNITEDNISPMVMLEMENGNLTQFCDSDAVIAKVLQCQYDKEHDEEIERIEKKRKGHSNVWVSYENYKHVPSDLLFDSDCEEEDAAASDKKDWDRFETNEKEFASLPKRGYIMKDGAMVTKHDSVINGRRNAGKVMAFPPEFCTGDGAGFDMKLPNSVFNQLKAHSSGQTRRHKKLDRKDVQATVEKGLDEKTRLILFKLVNTTNMLEDIDGVIATGKESVVLHASSDSSFDQMILPRECAIKVFKTTLNEFKTRDKYIEDDYRFRNRFSKQNPRKIVRMWAEKEMHNMMRLQKLGINCPDMILLKKHVLVMSFIGRDNKAAPKLKDVILKDSEWKSVYNEVVDIMYKMFNVGHMIHADFSEYNILWHDRKCYVIDVSQSVQPDHPNGLEFLLRDCGNISHFFKKKGVPDVRSPEELFKHITGFSDIDVNLLEGVRSHYNTLSCRFEIDHDDERNTAYPFDYCWDKTNEVKAAVGKDDDQFEDMWERSLKEKKIVDSSSSSDEDDDDPNKFKEQTCKDDKKS